MADGARNYYNEIDPHAAQWIRNLIAAGHIAPGDVDERSIEDVRPDDLRGYVQCHFFAGIAGWAYALDLARWPRDRPVWTGSCPCQPFSAAGKGAGFDDERHLWPAWQHLIAQCRPTVVFGEQVASKAADPWIDLVHADLEGMGYDFGCVPFPAAGVGAPHIRDRNYWMAHADDARLEGWGVLPERADQCAAGSHGLAGGLADCASGGRREEREDGRGGAFGDCAQGHAPGSVHGGNTGGLGDANSATGERGTGGVLGAQAQVDRARLVDGREHHGPADAGEGLGARPGPTNGQWRDADWLGCTDGRWRPVEPGTFPLAHGIPGRVGRLRAYGNAIVPQQAAEFVAAYMEARAQASDLFTPPAREAA